MVGWDACRALPPDQAGFAEGWALERQFAPQMEETERDRKYDRWSRAVKATLAMGG